LNGKDYIESGILELYASGALPAEERKEVELMLQQYPELRIELSAIEAALESYAFAHQKKPSKDLLQPLLQKIASTESNSTGGKTIELPPPAKKSSGNIVRMLAYAATILLFISIAINVYYYSNYQRMQDELAEMKDQNTLLADQYNVMQADFSKLKGDMDVVMNPSYLAVTMEGMPISPQSVAVVYWDKATGSLYINPNNLPDPGPDKQYQLWALKDGTPLDAGVFEMKAEMQQMKQIMDADAFAVTLEPKGGSPSPTLEFLYVIGNV
jgi:anti-sigma-K factor RskA